MFGAAQKARVKIAECNALKINRCFFVIMQRVMSVLSSVATSPILPGALLLSVA
jgi:hypothetical protein